MFFGKKSFIDVIVAEVLPLFQNEILYHIKSQTFTVFVLDPSVKIFLIQRFGCVNDSNSQFALHIFQLFFHHS
jgi:hypothetical protein